MILLTLTTTKHCPIPENNGREINVKETCPGCGHFTHISYIGGFPVISCMFPKYNDGQRVKTPLEDSESPIEPEQTTQELDEEETED